MSFYKAFGIYTICGVLAKSISFLLLPFFTHYLSQADYGIITIFSNSVYFIAPLMNMGIGETFTVEYSKFTQNDVSSFISTSLLIPLVVLCGVALGVLMLGGFIQNLTGLRISLQYLICLFGFSNFFGEYLFTILRNKNKPLLFGLIAIAKTVIELGLAVYFIRYCGDGYMGRVKSMFVATVITGGLCLCYFLSKGFLKPAFSKQWARIILKRGLPTIPFFFMIFTLNNADNYTVNYYYGSAKVGPYGLAFQVALLVNFVTSSFITPFYPFMYESLNKGDMVKVIGLIVRYTIFLAGLILLIGYAAPIVFSYFISNKFHEALKYLWWLLTGQFFYSLYLVLAGFIFYKKHNNIYYYFSPLIILITFLTNYSLIGVLRIQQFGLASAVAYFLCFAGAITIYHKQILRGVGLYTGWLKSRINITLKR